MPNIAFSQVSPNRRRPLFTAEVDASRANSARSTFRSVLAAGNDGVNTTLTNFEPVRVFSESDVAARAGVGSTLHLMARHFFAANPDGEVFVHPIEVSAAAQPGDENFIDLSFTSAATADGVITVGIIGERVAVYVAKDTQPAAVAEDVCDAMKAHPIISQFFTMSCTPAGAVKFQRRSSTIAASDFAMRIDTGTTGVAIERQNTDFTRIPASELTGLEEQEFDLLVLASTGAADLTAARNLVNARWDSEDMRYGYIIAAKSDTLSNLVVAATADNEEHETIFGVRKTNAWVNPLQIAAAAAGVCARSLSIDPGRPLQTLSLPLIQGEALGAQFTGSEQESLLTAGISPIAADAGGEARIVRMVTSYKTNAHAQPDNAFYPANVSFLLAACIRFLAIEVTSKFGRHKLANDSGSTRPAANTVTPSIIRGAFLAAYDTLIARGWVTAADDFAENLRVVRNAEDPNRVDILWPGALIGQLNVVAVKAEFRRIGA